MKLTRNKTIDQDIFDFVSNTYHQNKQTFSAINFRQRFEHADLYGSYKQNKLNNFILTNNNPCRIFRKRTKLAALGYICAEKLGRSLKQVFQELFKELNDEGIPIANLNSKTDKFFSTIGFENTIFQKEFKFNTNYLELKNKIEGSVKIGDWDNLIIQNGAAQLYEVPMHSDSERNTLNRAYWWWNMLDKMHPENKLLVYFGRVGLPIAYMFFKTIKAKNEIKIYELYAQKAEGLYGIMDYLKTNYSDTILQMIMPESSHLEHLIRLQDHIEIKIRPKTMTRIINVKSVLEALNFEKDGVYNIEVAEDSLCPWNNGCWRVEQKDNQILVRRTSVKPDLYGSINAWTKVFLGNITINQSLKLGEIERITNKDIAIQKGKVTFLDNY